ncbi:DUF6602 domain-containing protein [Flavobacterium terrigena]|uniref:DUF6602 domain-containing protein n=1 Tax=Flavobacterium terrigena TaxID=402734 RepID=A0A1H6UT88_9FLAO|nr:DUF6602 domain-containing protein [Flavobacterium terrigena]SEI91520.1 hypothetical protein SAMN05660918_1907 [Flavobacterium terrigena]
MENYFGQHGWKEFNQNRETILSEFDKIIQQTKNRPVQIAHGLGVEAHIRKWLSEFLPKKYGVTSGYIIPNLYNDNIRLYHYDIIIFNQLEAPILWTEGNYDQSEQGKYRAIPAKHVVAVYEVKSRLTKLNVSNSIKKLNETESFKEQLNPLYSCGVIFIDLKEKDNNDESIIKELMKGKDVFGFTGGMVLRYENDYSAIGRISLLNGNPIKPGDKIHSKPIAKPIDDLSIYSTEDGEIITSEFGAGVKLLQTPENTTAVTKCYGTMYGENSKSIYLYWSRSYFADFHIDLLSTLEGIALNDKNRTVFGQIFDILKIKKASLQNSKPEKGKPFLEVKLREDLNKIDYNSSKPLLKFVISIKNTGNVSVIYTGNSFKTKSELPAGETSEHSISFEMDFTSDIKNLKEHLRNEKIEIPVRIVYYPINNKEFCSVEKVIKITEKNIEFL